MPPVYSPQRGARAILRCAEHPRREVLIGGAPFFLSLFHLLAPWLFERLQPQLVARTHLGRGPAPKIPGNIPDTLPPYDDDAGWRRGRESVLQLIPAKPVPPLMPAAVGEE